MARISQREARRLRKQVAELEKLERDRWNAWTAEWPLGIHIASMAWGPSDVVPVAIRTARKLKHAVVVVTTDDGTVYFYALPLAESRRRA